MPIYEFKCLKCGHFFEWLTVKEEDTAKPACPECDSPEFERVLSATNYSMSAGSSAPKTGGPSVQNRTCSSGSCSTYEIPGPS
ncbi:FmdB family transcriptional regulator [Candidatus Desulfarcum epimagneticum]|uniref:FmdB family transcriptional regulator n=1 Tax=uncultured Desulfobacteraceae bacterium TaxID=218296 RepID=A0A484HJL1_9BACT|nr:FmdB family transcriptional regulator [uncultured Desulfobacteraceae bacterium]